MENLQAVHAIMSIICLGLIFILIKKLNKRPLWKSIVVVLIGLFSFSISLPFEGSIIQVAILPLGVWILYAFMRKKEGVWVKYRKLAWLGFLSNYLFMFATLGSALLQELVYPPNELTTYVSEITDAQLLPLHPSGNTNASLTKINIDTFEPAPFFVDSWYEETNASIERNKVNERFPYMLIGVQSKWGSGITSTIYIERDGKAILISTDKTQYYFRSSQSILKEEGQ